ncbi:ribonuclease M5 [Alkalihalobacillus trypoxylicola]|uniref:Ribonuclease M5 n=1 Tax=Alkalihalobacillus trypoxylicola TaxID=519424 RepID=A0A161PI48_9BACI|nr:ribonuclease M5 [Alkalihalobacillus trypoxylicola]KYG33288.1 ribonuclease M5 [Alkalihalobacillus trypoxylicola]
MKIKEVIVVEGKDDTTAIKRAVNADTIETNGSALNEMTLKKIALANERRGVIIFTDPDYPGEKIRKQISAKINGCKHAFLPKKEAISKNGDDLGIENATPEAIRLALENVRQEYEEPGEQITRNDLHTAGLIAGTMAKRRRELLGDYLGIGYANGKQLYVRLKTFHISKEEFANALQAVYEAEETQ